MSEVALWALGGIDDLPASALTDQLLRDRNRALAAEFAQEGVGLRIIGLLGVGPAVALDGEAA